MKVVTYVHKGKVRTFTLEELQSMKSSLTKAWEDACTNCGKCCFSKSLTPQGAIINYNKPCKFLKFNGEKSQCTVYEDRFAKQPKCCSVPAAISKFALPADCPYVAKLEKYSAPIDNERWLKRAKAKLQADRYDADEANAGTPTAGTMNVPAAPPLRVTAEDAEKAKMQSQKPEWMRRNQERAKLKAGGQQGMIDPRQKTDFNIKPSGHALGG
jgi:uncharacterized cysteine cluster protein YcgN (CxxCxxCC family)